VKTVILCGGKGTRAYPHTIDLPKPLLEVAGRPILEHVMEIYAGQGFDQFVLAAGFKVELIAAFAKTLPPTWDVEVVDTGEDTNTGGRVAKVREYTSDPFFLTYGDGVGDVDLVALAEFHSAHDGNATIECDADGRVLEFKEKPSLPDHWINAGFMVMSQGAFDHWAGEDLERDVLPALGGARQLFAYRHRGFWKSMDTYKDALELTALCPEQPAQKADPKGTPPWIRSAASAS
jgi:glucose-1-phosphate cytidylyltransferase